MKDISERDWETNLRRTRKRAETHKTSVRVGSCVIGGKGVVVIAGPCAVESLELTRNIAERVLASGGTMLRGGAFKPLTFPYRTEKYCELGEKGLEVLDVVRKQLNIPVVTEVTDVRAIEAVCRCSDMLQIGARNMQNFVLLEEAARTGQPILLKRHFGSSLRDWLGAAEYLLYHGNPNVVLCERGIVAPHTHSPTSRFIVDLEVVPAAQEVTHLPILVDVSHATSRQRHVGPVARAAIAIGADGILVDVHPMPEQAAVDPYQALDYAMFERLMEDLRKIAKAVDRDVAVLEPTS